MNDSFYGISVFVAIVAVLFYVGLLALGIWINYLLMRTAVKNGTIHAHEELARRDAASLAQRERRDAETSAQRALAEIRANRARAYPSAR